MTGRSFIGAVLVAGVAAPVLLPALPAAAQPTSVMAPPAATPATTALPWHGSTLTFDQSATTQTIGLGADYQSYNPTYEWWVAFRPRYFLYETMTNAVSVNAWANLYLELTNSDTTTRMRELLVGPTYVWATYGHTIVERNGYKTSLSIGPRATIPTDKAARGSGQIIGLGAIAGLSQAFPLLGKSARALTGARLGINAIFNHPFSRATTAINDDIRQPRQDVGERLIISDQLTGGMGLRNGLNVAFTGQLQVVSRLDLSLSYVLINAWTYAPTGGCLMVINRPTCDPPMTIPNPQTSRVNTWATASLNYLVLDDLSISLGYYNLARQIGEDGTRRNPLWSPSARVFLSLTGNLDVTYGRLTRTPRARN